MFKYAWVALTTSVISIIAIIYVIGLKKLIGLVGLFIVFTICQNWRAVLDRIRQHYYALFLPGPWELPILGIFFRLVGGSGPGLMYLLKQSEKVRARGHNFMTANVLGRLWNLPLTGEAAQPLLDSPEELLKGRDYDFYKPWIGNGLLTSSGARWRKHRRLSTPMFHFRKLDGYTVEMNVHCRRMTEIIANQVHKEIDFKPIAKLCALDIICVTALGQHFNAQCNPGHPYIRAVDEYSKMVQYYSIEPWRWINWIWKLFFEKEHDEILVRLKNFTNEATKSRIEYRNKMGDRKEELNTFLDSLLDCQAQNGLSLEDVREEVDTFTFAGHDTTSAAISWLLWCLATNPDHQNSLYEEIISVVGVDDRFVNPEELKSLPLLDRMLKESMRLYSTVPFMERLLTNDMRIDGSGSLTIPSGSEIFVSPILIHMNPDIYPNPHVFDPDRFQPEKVAARHSYDYIPFSAGPRSCLGQKFGVIEVKIMAIWLIRRFIFSSNRNMHDNMPIPEVILQPSLGIPITFIPRDNYIISPDHID